MLAAPQQKSLIFLSLKKEIWIKFEEFLHYLNIPVSLESTDINPDYKNINIKFISGNCLKTNNEIIVDIIVIIMKYMEPLITIHLYGYNNIVL